MDKSMVLLYRKECTYIFRQPKSMLNCWRSNRDKMGKILRCRNNLWSRLAWIN